MATSSASAHVSARRQPISCMPVDQPVVALTFDDGPHEPNTRLLLELFAREGVKATFFETGRNVAAHPALARAVVAAGHEIGNHTVSHAKLPELADEEDVHAEIVGAQRIVEETAGVIPTVFRAPCGLYDDRVWRVLDELGLQTAMSSVSTGDWSQETSGEMTLERATVNTGPGDIVLMHTWQDRTVAVMPEIVRRLKARGLGFVTVSGLIALRRKETALQFL